MQQEEAPTGRRERESSSRIQRFGATEVKEDGSETVEKNPRNPHHQQQQQQHQIR
jgi:hypothetical protein